MNNLNLVEDLRRRAKDNKAKNAEYYLSLSFDSIKDLRTVLFTIPTIAFAYIQSGFGEVSNPNCFKFLFFLSFLIGILSYIFFWIGSLTHSNHYADREAIFRDSITSSDEYNKMIKKEDQLISQYSNKWFNWSFTSVTIQLILIFLLLFQL